MTKTKALRTTTVTLGLALGCQGLLGIEDGDPLPADTCRLASDCKNENEICVFETCSPPCRTDKDCGGGQRCLEGADGAACVASTSATCTEATDCPSATTCIEGECRTECSTAADCRDDQVCSETGACVGQSELPPMSNGGTGNGEGGGGASASGSGGAPQGGAGAGPDLGGQGGQPMGGAAGQGGEGGTLGGVGGEGGSGGEGGEVIVVPPPTPDTSITSTPPNPDNATTPTFQFTSTIAGSTFQCKLDAGNFSACTSPRQVTLAGEGEHTFQVVATAAGQTDQTPASYTWTLDVTPPTVDIVTGPAAITASTNANFTLSAEAGVTLACKLDGGAFGACDSATAHALSGLATGSHTLTLRATDAANNQATDTYEWFIEPPCVPSEVEFENITQPTGWTKEFGGVLHNGNGLSAQSINAPIDVAFEGKGVILYLSKGPNLGNLTVSIDGSAPITLVNTDPNGFSYQQPATIVTGLANKTHTMQIICTKTYCSVDYFKVTCN